MSRTKIVGYLLVLLALLKTGVDALDGSGFDYKAHLDDVFVGLNGAGLIFLRSALEKMLGKVL